MDDRYEKMLRGAILYIIYTAYVEKLTNADSPRTVNKGVLEMTLSSRFLMPEKDDMPRCLDWLEGAGYVEVEWGLDTRRDYDSVTITQKGLNLIMDRNAKRTDPNVNLPPRTATRR